MKVTLQTEESKACSGFTLIEIILAIGVAGLVLAAAASFLVSISNIWVTRQERNFFEDHVDGVTEFLRASFDSAGIEIATASSNEDTPNNNEDSESSNEESESQEPPEATLDTENEPQADNEASADESNNSGLLRRSDEPIGWGEPPGFAAYENPLINFKLNEVPPLFVSPDNAPVAGIDVFFHFEEDEGLSLLWYSILQEESEDLDDLRRTEISQLVKTVHYIYWDERFEKWEEETEPMEGDGDDQFILPRFIKLTFEYEGVTKERIVAIPVQSRSALIF
ncbi:MAG: prepilin-type N-terminal cleavage/methylation domain-containing protein [Verrucomicrobiota bacterium]